DPTTTLTDGSDDVWKTLRIWIEAAKLPDQSAHLVYCLFTTACAPPGSACELLRPGAGRNVAEAIVKLDAAAAASKSDSLKKAMTSWQSLSAAEKNELLGRTHVLDCAPNATGLREEI